MALAKITFSELTLFRVLSALLVATEMDDYIRITTWFVRQVLDAYENWNGKDNVPPKIQELMMVLQIEASHHYK